MLWTIIRLYRKLIPLHRSLHSVVVNCAESASSARRLRDRESSVSAGCWQRRKDQLSVRTI